MTADSSHPPPMLWLEDDPAGAVRQASATLQASGVVVFPTDTVYGLLAAVTAREPYQRILELKGRPAAQPLALLVLVEDPLAHRVLELLSEFPGEQLRFEQGSLTVVVEPGALPSADQLELALCIQPGRIGLRCPASHEMRQLLSENGGLLWATSVNQTGSPPALTAADVALWLEALEQAPELVILSRSARAGRPSAVTQLSSAGLLYLRD